MQTRGHLATPATPNAMHPGPQLGHGGLDPHTAAAWQARPKKHVADLLDDAGALADWHRNLDRLRHPERA